MSCGVVSPPAIYVDAYGVPVELRAYDAELLSALRRVIPPGASIAEPDSVATAYSIVEDDGSYVLLADGSRVAESTELDEILARLESALHFHVAVAARTRLFVHAGVVGWNGQPMSPGETVLTLLANTLAARTRPADALRILAAVARHASGIHGERGDAAAAVEQILTTGCPDDARA